MILEENYIVGDTTCITFQVFHGQPVPATVAAGPHPPAMRPRVRARRGQATDPHSIAERLHRGRIAERIWALQELVPSVNKVRRSCSGVRRTWGNSPGGSRGARKIQEP